MARITRTAYKTEVDDKLPDVGALTNSPITPVNHRGVVKDGSDSVFWLETDLVRNGLSLLLPVTDGDPAEIALGGDLVRSTTIGGAFPLSLGSSGNELTTLSVFTSSDIEFNVAGNEIISTSGTGTNVWINQASVDVNFLVAANGGGTCIFADAGEGTVSLGKGINSTVSGRHVGISENSTTKAHLNLKPNTGVDKTTPESGDLWYNGTNLYFRDSTTNVDLLSGGFTLTDGNGTTANGTAVDLGGALTADTTINGAYDLQINTSGGRVELFRSNQGLLVTADQAKLSVGANFWINLTKTTGHVLKDNSEYGLIGDGAYWTNASSNDNAYAQYGWIKSHLCGQAISSILASPSVSEDLFSVVWDETAGDFTLADTNPISGTNDFIPIFNSSGNGIEDSVLSVSEDGNLISLEWNPSNTSSSVFSVIGASGDVSDNEFRMSAVDHPTNVYPTHSAFLDSNEVKYTQSRNTNTGTATTDYHSFSLPQNGYSKFDVYNFKGVDTGTPTSFVAVYGGIDYMCHKYGTSVDPRSQSSSDNYTWCSDNNQHMIVGAMSGNTNDAGALSSINAHLNIYSLDTTTNPEPHLRFIGDYNETTNGAASDDSIFLSSVTSRLTVRESGSNYNLVTRDIFELTGTTDPGAGTWSLQYDGTAETFSWV